MTDREYGTQGAPQRAARTVTLVLLVASSLFLATEVLRIHGSAGAADIVAGGGASKLP